MTYAPPEPDVAGIVKGIITGEERLEVALAAWRERHGLRLTDVSKMIGYQPSAVSAMLHDPARLPGVRDAVAQLIGYRERAPARQEIPTLPGAHIQYPLEISESDLTLFDAALTFIKAVTKKGGEK